MSVPTPSSSIRHDASSLRQILLGQVDYSVPPTENNSVTDNNSFIIWPSERVVRPDDHQEVTIWQTSTASSSQDSITIHQLTAAPDTVPTAATSFIQFAPAPTQFPIRSGKRTALRIALLGVMILSFMVMASLVIPDVYYRLQPETVSEVAVTPLMQLETSIQPPAEPALPPTDPSLPQGERLRIPTIGVDAAVLATTNPDEALEKGAWMVPDFGRPTDFSQPTIIASHRYGWLWWWQSDFGRKNSFYNLPETKPGDQIEVITDQRKFVYEIYAREEGQSITDYSADLILYTCKFLNSPERYFVYAKRLPPSEAPTANESQSGGATVFDKS